MIFLILLICAVIAWPLVGFLSRVIGIALMMFVRIAALVVIIVFVVMFALA